MALIRCSECEEQISDKAQKCPHCGCPIAADRTPQRVFAEDMLSVRPKHRRRFPDQSWAVKKTVLILIGLLVVVGLPLAVLRNRAQSPERVVLRTFELLRTGDIAKLQECYTPEAWGCFSQYAEGFDNEQKEALRNSMGQVAGIQVKKTEKLADGVRVSARITTKDGASEIQEYMLRKLPDGKWRID